mgnify:CR=1 FL=1
MKQVAGSPPRREIVADAGTTNPHYLEIRRMIEAGIPLPKTFYNEEFVGPGGVRPPRVNRASFSVHQPQTTTLP